MAADEAVIGEATELLQRLIRNHCVNDGTAASGDEVRNSELLAVYLSGAGSRRSSRRSSAASSSSASKAHQGANLSLPVSKGATRRLRACA